MAGEKKLFLGYKLRRLRDQKGMSQAAFAKELELSPSYLNQIENNQRPVTLPVLLRLSRLFDVDIHTFVEDQDARLISDLRESLADPILGGGALSMTELRNIVNASPDLVRRLLTLCQGYHKLQERLQSVADTIGENEGGEMTAGPQYPYEEVRDYFYYKDNYFNALDTAAEELAKQGRFSLGDMLNDLVAHLKKKHDVRVVIEGNDDHLDETAMRVFDPETRSLHLSARLNGPGRAFHLAHQIALLSQREAIEGLVKEAQFTSEDAKSICRVGLANYFAGALIMPYSDFYAQARETRHDLEQLQSRFGASFEQVCHRLSTLQRPSKRGLPFYFVRVDPAGNITKRHSATRFHFARFGGACPLWNVHEAFGQPGKILVQLAEMPDQTNYICIARTVTKPGGAYDRPTRRFAIGLGCEASYASELVYSKGLDLQDNDAAVKIGVNCRICERATCQQRAFPPIGHKISVDEDHRSFVPYRFSV